MRFEWCNELVRKRADTALLSDVFWWERRDGALARIHELQQQANEDIPGNELNFCLAYASLALGNVSLFAGFQDKLRKIGNSIDLILWLEIEFAGRTRAYSDQARLVGRLLNKRISFPDWAMVACFASLNHNGIDPKPLYRLLTNSRKLQSPLEALLVARLASAMARPDQALKILKAGQLKWPGIAALHWFGGMLLAQIGDPIKSSNEIEYAESLGLIDIQAARFWMGLSTSLPRQKNGLAPSVVYRRIAKYVSSELRQSAEMAGLYCIYLWMIGDLTALHKLLQQYHEFQDFEEHASDRAAQIFMRYAVFLCISWQHNKHLYLRAPEEGRVVFIGESHALSSSNISIAWMGMTRKVSTHFLMGAKMWHFASMDGAHYQTLMRLHVERVPPATPIVFVIGEIDCRPNEGIWREHKKSGKVLSVLIKNTVNGYLNFIEKITNHISPELITISGIPAPGYSLDGSRDPGDVTGFLDMIRQVNSKLKAGTLMRRWGFLDVYSATSDSSGKGNKKWHLDNWHLQPVFYANSEGWIVKSAE